MEMLFSSADIDRGVRTLGDQLSADYASEPLTVVGVLTGGLVFLADLIRAMPLPVQVGVVQASSYRGSATTSGPLTISLANLPSVAGRHVVIVDDIFDTGQTLDRLTGEVEALGAASVKTAVLLWKTARRQVARTPDYVVFEIPDRFVVGYGLDFADEYRHLPYLCALQPDEINFSNH